MKGSFCKDPTLFRVKVSINLLFSSKVRKRLRLIRALSCFAADPQILVMRRLEFNL